MHEYILMCEYWYLCVGGKFSMTWVSLFNITSIIPQEHLNGNMVNLLLVGPPCEREFGTHQLTKIFLWVAAASGLAHMVFGPANTLQLGASGKFARSESYLSKKTQYPMRPSLTGVVFALILLSSLVSVRGPNSVPLTFICQGT